MAVTSQAKWPSPHQPNDRHLTNLMAVALPLLLVLTGFAWSKIPAGSRNRLPAGIEVLPFMLVLGAGIYGCIEMSIPFENLVFEGDFAKWLRNSSGLPFDQRNAIVVGMAMGFAVIPIIFAISEDAFSNVPKQLVSGSLALGATLWQTVTRVVVPTASPGIFSAIMVALGLLLLLASLPQAPLFAENGRPWI